ncbi:tRNA uracil 4-sulfurtransferase ThiI [Candidatus Nitrospira inopinata]|jgi:thiamine biosynthesis protein ThiI|uniref:Probable tRNA sulfurtransferase n=1 Tax=Candidatus Nitrospira inopinata TaxID=1715989 RepID=A0A0S4KWU0_9BACT|nr:tRNA uracil 4-sulfurtransferase ThiI [Candidatus Nitrospira inopinata]CUQ67688.1 putative tRNA sulfurtransferase [Candidatus Nitrospira inopinata]
MYCAIVHYHELALKGRNRDFFERRLVRNVHLALKDLGEIRVEQLHRRVRVVFQPDAKVDVIRDRLTRVCGVANFFMARAVPLDLAEPRLDKLSEAVIEEIRAQPFSTFRVTAKRADKRLSVTSMDVERAVGAAVCRALGKSVSLKNPDQTIYIELLSKEAYVSTEKIDGPGGMPVGVSGKVVCLLSGGIDSPVAAYRMIKRGCRAVFVHFSGRPLVSRASEEKARDLVKLLTSYQYKSRLYIVPFGEIQRDIVLNTPAPFRVVLYRRMMLRIAEHIAERERCWGMVTGDSLGQVASQTPENLSVIGEAATLPILRPLIGMDKIEITDEARKLGTYEISIEPDQDCCKLFTPPHPSLKTRRDVLQNVEKTLDVPHLIRKGIEKIEVEAFTFPA